MDPALSVAVTGPTGTFGHGLMPLLESSPDVGRVVGVARRPFDPAAEGWAKLDYRQGDVRDEAGLKDAFAGCDVVVHLAFLIVGGTHQTRQAINVEGTLNAFRAAAAVGARRFVYASSVAAYGFHPDNPDPIREDWPTRPAKHLQYSQEKAELERVLQEEAAAHPSLELYLLRPSIVLGPDAVGAKLPLGLDRFVDSGLRRVPVPIPVPVPDLPVQLVHQDDVGSALLQCVLGAGPAGAYNIAGDGVPSAVDLARELGLLPVTVPSRPVQALSGLVARYGVLQQAGWAEVLEHPPVMDTTKAKQLLGWQPSYTGIEAFRATLDA